MNTKIIQAAIDDLREHRELTDKAIAGLTALVELYASIAIPPPAAPQVSKKIGQLKPKEKPQKQIKPKRKRQSPGDCVKHPGNTEWDTNGACSPCRREYQNRKRIEKKSGSPAVANRTTPALRATPPDSGGQSKSGTTPRSEFGDELEYSKPVKCPKCGSLNTRMSRPEDFDRDTGSWTCLANGCQVRIAHIVLPVDRAFDAQETTG